MGVFQFRGWALAFFAVGSAFFLGCNRAPPPVVSSKPPEVIVDKPVYDTVLDYEDFIGRTEGLPMVEVRARVSGQLTRIFFVDGAEVKKGDPLFEIDPRPFDLEVKRTTAALAKAEATLKGKNALFKIAQRLRREGNKNLSQEDYENAESAYEEAKADRDLAIENKKIAEQNAEYCHVKAEISGRISRRKIDEGNQVTAYATLLTTIVGLDPIYANFDVDERTVLRMQRLKQRKEISLGIESANTVQVGLADEEGFSLTGLVEFSENMLDPGTGTLRDRVRISNPINNGGRLLSPNMFVRVRFPVGQPHKALLVPEQALVSDQGIRHLFILNDKDEAVYTPVTLGQQQGEMRVITKGISEKDRVIVSGLQRVRPGIKVTPKPAEKRPSPSAVVANSERGM